MAAIRKGGSLKRPGFFFWFGVLLFLLAVGGFGLRASLDAENLPPMRAWLTIHALSSGLWLAWVPLQAILISQRQLRLHRSFGLASLPLAVVVLISGVVISFEFFERTDFFFAFFPGVLNLILFFVCYALAMLQRRDGAFHKRLMTFASLALIPPAFNRVVFAFGLDMAVTHVTWLLLVLVVPIHDRLVDGCVGRGSKVGVGLVLASVVGSIVGIGMHRELVGG